MTGELTILRNMLGSFEASVRESVKKAGNAIKRRDTELARSVTVSEIYHSHMSLDIEDRCVNLITTHQFPPYELREITSIVKMNKYIRLISSHSAKIAAQSLRLKTESHECLDTELAKSIDHAIEILEILRPAIATLDGSKAWNALHFAVEQTKDGNEGGAANFSWEENLHCNGGLAAIYCMVKQDIESIVTLSMAVAGEIVFTLDGEYPCLTSCHSH